MPEIESPIDILGMEYKDDLIRLKTMNPVAITKYDINKLSEMSNKYQIKDIITKQNYYEIKGTVVGVVLSRLEQFAIKHVLGKAIEETPSKVSVEPNIKRQLMPESIKKKLSMNE